MLRYSIVIFLSFLATLCRGQTFKGGLLNIASWGGYSATDIQVANLPNQLDGVNLGLESVEIYCASVNPISKINLFLLAPDGTKVTLTNNNGSNTNVSGILKFAMNAPLTIQNWTATSIFPNTSFRPNQSLNAFSNNNNNNNNPNGTWKLYGELTSSFALRASARLDSVKLIFGKTNINKAEPNDECRTATALKIMEPITEINTGNYSSNLNYVTWKTDVLSSQVGGSPSGNDWTENTAWYSFQPLCENDKIYIKNSEYSGAQIGIFEGCANKINIDRKALPAVTGGVDYTFNFSTLDPLKTYYVVIDGVNGYYVNIKELIWQKGTTGCAAVTITTGAINPTSYCRGSAVNIRYEATGTFTAGNIFTAQLSNASGSFTNPVTIGTLSALVSATITATLPANLSNGTGYKIRVISSAPTSVGIVSAANISIKNKPTAPTAIVGEANPCGGQTNLLYSVSSVANTVSYLWKRSSGGALQAELGKPDSSSIRITNSAVNEIIGVQARNECGLSAVFEKLITLATNPTMPVFKTFQTELCEGATNALFAVEPILGNNYSWKFPTGTIVTGATADSSEVKITAGISSGLVIVTSKNGCGTLTAPSRPLTINKKPNAPTVINSDNLICTNKNNYSFSTNAVDNATQYHWAFPLGYIINNASANDSLTIFVKPSKSIGAVKVAAVNQCGRSATFEKILNIDSLPPTPTTDKPQIQLCEDLPRVLPSLVVNKPAGANYTYSWTLPPFTQISSATLDSATVALVLQSNISSATVTVRSRNACGLSANALSITHKYVANEPPTVTITYADTAICKNALATYKATATNGGSTVQYNWYIGGVLQTGFSESIFTTNQIAANTTIQCKITSTLTCANPKDAESLILIVKIVEDLAPQIAIQAQSTEVCAGESTAFLANIKNAGTLPVIKWYVNQIEILNEQDVVFSPVAINNNDKVYATLLAAQKCTTAQPSISNTVTITTVASITPSITLSTISPNTVCEGTDVTFNATVRNVGTDFQYEWLVNNLLIANNDKTLILTSIEGINNIVCKVSTSSACATVGSATSNDITIFANAKPLSPLAIEGQPELCEGDKQKIFSVNETSKQKYIWSLPDFVNGTSDTNSIVLDAPRKGEGLLSVFAENDCGKSDTILLTIAVASCELLYVPNIFTGNLSLTWQIEGLNNYPEATIKVYNRWGSAVHESTSKDKPWDGTTNGNPLPAGTYYYVIDLHDKARRTITGSITVIR